jgi:carbamoyl-phosphate synthase large subunit
MADKIYFLPVTSYFVEQVIKKEKPDSILLSFGGQTALNCGLELEEKGILNKYNIRAIGTPILAIKKTEDRDLFIKTLNEINVKTPKSKAVTNVKDAIKAAEEIGYPIMIRSGFALGGLGSGIAQNETELKYIAKKALSACHQILVEEYLKGWKEIEYEVVRDCDDNCITVCNMENFDPMGIHTGESIVVAPSQTLTNSEYHNLREISIKVIRKLGIIGECNIQYALNPNSEDYRVIEVNARLSRSSALASKATGYPLAFVAAKLALGYSLIEIENSITKKTKACFEPALDYVVVKVPRWDLHKFKLVEQKIDSEMKSVGEVMAIGRKFEEAIQKAVRMLQLGFHGLSCNQQISFTNLEEEIKNPTDKRILVIAEALRHGFSIDKIYKLSGIDRWFLYKIKNIIELEKIIKNNNLTKEILLQAKQHGFSDHQIGELVGKRELEIRKLRLEYNIKPYVKQIDTLAAEYPAKTNYLYLTYNGNEHDISFNNKKAVIVLGSGSYSIGSSVEFDWCCVNSALTSKKLGYETIMINYNPETVSTDYDMCNKLYFDELTFERVMDIYELEEPLGIIISMGGQIPNNIAMKLHSQKVRILGTSPESIDNAENRHKFSALLDKLNIDQPEWKEASTIDDAKKFAKRVSYPVLIRPSYVLSGAAMNVVFNDNDLSAYLKKASDISPEHPVVISKFIENAKEVEIDAVASSGELILYAITEHVEMAGVHSGDATMVLPAQKLYLETIRRIIKDAKKLAKTLEITGPFNIQFIAKDNHLKVIECNLRASRSFPFCSKIFKKNFIDIATKAILKSKIPKISNSTVEINYVGVKAPQFSFSRLKGADPVLGVEMSSTGEVACLGEDVYEAFLKSLISVGYKFPEKNVLLSTGPVESKAYLLESIRKLKQMGYVLYATKGTANFLKNNQIECEMLYWPLENKKPNIIDYIIAKKIDFVINIPKSQEREELTNDYIIRRKAVDFSIPLITNTHVAKLFIDAMYNKKLEDLKIKSWDEYL